MTKEERAYNYASTRKATKFKVGEIAKFYNDGYEQAEKDIISLIESRLSELLGDAQPTPILRAELRELIDEIMEKE
jgi:hypothetical protein